MRNIDGIRIGIFVFAIGVATFTWAATGLVFIDTTIAQTLIGTFSVLAGFLVSALAFIQPVEQNTTNDKAINAEIKKRTIRLSAFFYLYLLNIFLLLAYTVFREAPQKPFDEFGKAALGFSLFSLVLSLEVPRMVIKLRTFQRQPPKA